MRTFRPGEILYPNLHSGGVHPAVGDVVTFELSDRAGLARIQGGYPVDELETYAECSARLTEEAEKSRGSPGTPKPANKPLL